MDLGYNQKILQSKKVVSVSNWYCYRKNNYLNFNLVTIRLKGSTIKLGTKTKHFFFYIEI